jgi:hypothetical protein
MSESFKLQLRLEALGSISRRYEMKRLAIVLSLCTIFVLSMSAQQQSKPYVDKQAPMEHWSG